MVRWLVIIGICSCLSGCAPIAAPLITTAPNAYSPFAGPKNPLPSLEDIAGVDQHFFVNVGSPQSSLAVSIVEPTDRSRPPEGTIIVLHGIRARSVWMMPVARVLSEKGYRAVLIDMRGHGRSTGSQITYGVQESLDVSQVIDHLERSKMIAGKIGVYGVSFGASTALQLAANDDRIKSVVAVAPYSSLSEVAPDYIAGALPGVGTLMTKGRIQAAVDRASAKAGFHPDATDCLSAIKQTQAPVLLIHGTSDRLIPVGHSQRLHDANPDSHLVLVPKYGHLAVQFDPSAIVVSHGVEWFDQTLPAVAPQRLIPDSPASSPASAGNLKKPSTAVP
ncbi:MAG: alpha/beta fold hydrolase [Pirellulales bacterium]